MLALHEEIPLVDPTAADGAFSLLWLIIALPLAGAAILLVGGALFPKQLKVWGHVLGTLLPIGSFVISLVLFLQLLGSRRGRPAGRPAPLRLHPGRRPSTSAWTCSTTR